MAFKKIGFGQVEPNQLSAQKTGQIYASLPLDDTCEVLENGAFMYYDYADGKVTAEPVDTDTVGEPMLVFNEIKNYEDRLRTKDFAMIRVNNDLYMTNPSAIGRVYPENYGWDQVGGNQVALQGGIANNKDNTITHSEFVDGYKLNGYAPRLFKTNVGDVYTTNMVEELAGDTAVYAQGDVLKLKKIGKQLVLSKTGDIESVKFVVAQVYTMPDGQPGLKIQRIA